MKAKVTFKNDFHNTESVKVATLENGIYTLSQDQINRAARECCGISGCTCGEFRGGIYNENGQQLYWQTSTETTLGTERAF